MSFLKAEWRKLVLANYEVDSSLLLPYLPYKTEIDTWNNRCYVSLVGFMFKNTKMLGLRIPFHINFEEVNLRFYVRYNDRGEWKRGVVFIKELVPKPAITFVANTLYKEHYETLRMKHTWDIRPEEQIISYQWKKNGTWQTFSVTADTVQLPITVGSEPEFITEHYWGYSKIKEDKTFEYEVTHPKWNHYKVKDFKITVDFGLTYGKDFNFLNDLKPTSVMLAEG
ncbi:MAG: hypothetical protein ACI8VT_003878, partial [Saprospiraceae bacterium]